MVGVIDDRCNKNGGKWVGVVLAERGSGKPDGGGGILAVLANLGWVMTSGKFVLPLIWSLIFKLFVFKK